jgi:uncharacterized membrane protein YqiK
MTLAVMGLIGVVIVLTLVAFVIFRFTNRVVLIAWPNAARERGGQSLGAKTGRCDR